MPTALRLPDALTDLTADVTLTSVARGDLLMRGASAWRNFAASSTAGQALTSGGSGADLVWATISSGVALGDSPTWTGSHTHTTSTTPLTITQGAASSGSPSALTVTGGAHTTLAASTEASDVVFNLARTVQFATGALATQRAVKILAPTYAFAGASTLTRASTVAIVGGPIAGTNATITNSHGLSIIATSDTDMTHALYIRHGTTGGGVSDGIYVDGPDGNTTFRVGHQTASFFGALFSNVDISGNGISLANNKYINLAGGYGHIGGFSNVPQIRTYQDLELLPGNLGVTGSKVTIRAPASRTHPFLQLQTSASASVGNVGGSIFDKFTDTSSTSTDGTEDDLISHTTVANTLAVNGDAIRFRWSVQTVAHATATRKVKVYFAGTAVYDSTALATAAVETLDGETLIERVSSTVVRCTTRVVNDGATAFKKTQYTELTGLTLTSTNILKLTGAAAAAGAASADIVAKMDKVEWLSAS